jgi:hypothetical protein
MVREGELDGGESGEGELESGKLGGGVEERRVVS